VLLNPSRAKPSQAKPMELIRLGFRLEADLAQLGLKNIKLRLARLEPWLVDGADGADQH